MTCQFDYFGFQSRALLLSLFDQLVHFLVLLFLDFDQLVGYGNGTHLVLEDRVKIDILELVNHLSLFCFLRLLRTFLFLWLILEILVRALHLLSQILEVNRSAILTLVSLFGIFDRNMFFKALLRVLVNDEVILTFHK